MRLIKQKLMALKKIEVRNELKDVIINGKTGIERNSEIFEVRLAISRNLSNCFSMVFS